MGGAARRLVRLAQHRRGVADVVDPVATQCVEAVVVDPRVALSRAIGFQPGRLQQCDDPLAQWVDGHATLPDQPPMNRGR